MADMFFPPDDPVHKNISMQRWLKHWLSEHPSINFSGLCTEMICQLIKERDPDYYEKYIHYLQKTPIKKKDIVQQIVKDINTH